MLPPFNIPCSDQQNLAEGEGSEKLTLNKLAKTCSTKSYLNEEACCPKLSTKVSVPCFDDQQLSEPNGNLAKKSSFWVGLGSLTC